MTWRGPEGIEPRLLADTRVRWPEVIPLARVLVLAPRIEPLLLRNARLRFLPRAGVEVESQLWFCPLVAARSTREIVLHLGLARVLAGELQGATPWPLDQPTAAPAADAARPQLAEVWRFTQAHTRHWSAEDRLERDLRYHALCDDDTAMDRGLKSLLAEIARESDPEGDPARRRDLARLAKRTLPALRPALAARSAATARLLARYAALALGDAGDWSKAAGAPDALPDWLQTKLPRAPTQARLGIEVRADDAHGQVLHLVEPEGDQPAIQLAIELPTALPARLHVAPAGHAGDWHPVRVGTRIPIRPPSPVLRLGTLDGRQWDLVCESLPLDAPPSDAPEPLLLVHAPADREQAQIIAGWLQAQHVAVDLVADDTPADSGESPAPTRILRLWTRAARERWSRTDTEPPVEPVAGLLLRIEDVALPDTGSGGAMLDWLDWKRLGASSAAVELAEAIARWWRDGALPPAAQAGDSAAPTAGATAAGDPDADTGAARPEEIRRLLAELDDPKTEPPRRLAIGDRLDELGDPRPGVGTIEIEVPVETAIMIETDQRESEKIADSSDRLSLDSQDIDVRAALHRLADLTDLNLVVSDTVRGNIALHLENVPRDEALDIILKDKGLSMHQTGNVIMVVPKEEIAAQERLELELASLLDSPADKDQDERDQIVYSGDPLPPLNFPDIELRAVLQLLADFTGLNLVASDTVRGNVTLRLKNVPWDQALDVILNAKGLSMRQTGNVIRVAPTQEIAARERLERELASLPDSPADKEQHKRERVIYSGDRLSLNVEDVEVRAALQQIADFAGLNLVASDTVRGNITLRLKNVPWDQALDIILLEKGLWKRHLGNVLKVAPIQEIAAQERLELESQFLSPDEAQRNPGEPAPSPTQALDAEIQGILEEIANPATEPPRRLAIGDRLAELGDPRPGVGVRQDGLPDIAWVEIPAGRFVWQDGETRELPTFWISRYPVTARQFRSYYRHNRDSESEPVAEASTTSFSPLWLQDNRPQTNVNWHEAMEFARWINKQLRLSPATLRLPTEWEWEKAARGPRGYIYPWGNHYLAGFANVSAISNELEDLSDLAESIAVGLYPHGKSAWGVEDLTGNVWEWCLNENDPAEALAPDVKVPARPLRGGSWIVDPDEASATSRRWAMPDSRLMSRGFRLVSSARPPI